MYIKSDYRIGGVNMEGIRYFVTFGNIIMAAIIAWFLKESTNDDASIISFSSLIFLLLASTFLMWWR